RNTITAPCIERWAVKDLIFQPSTADDLPILEGLDWQSHRRPVSEVIQARSDRISPVYHKTHQSYPSWDDCQGLNDYAWNSVPILAVTTYASDGATAAAAWEDAYVAVPDKEFRHYLPGDGRHVVLWGDLSGGGGVGVWMGAGPPELSD